MTEYFESHAHYDDGRFDGDRETLLVSLYENGVTKIINAAASLASTEASVKLAEAFPFVYASTGVHPHEASTLSEESLQWLEESCSRKKVVAVGEIGLDFYYDNSPREAQRFWFKRQLEMAARVNKPVIIHSREAAKETYEILAEWIEKHNPQRRGVIHSFSGSAQTALDYVKMGFYIGVGGVVTFDKTRKLLEAVKAVPTENILIETDSPYLTPAPNRGKRNDSSNLKYVVEKIAEIKGAAPEEIARAAYINACGLFGIG